jgi:NAD+ synthase
MMRFSRRVLDFDAEATAQRLAARLREATLTLKRRGVVVALSGGIDSSCVAALGVRALGADRVFGLMMPDRDSDEASVTYARELARALGITYEVCEISAILEATGCYRRREEAARAIFPDLTPDCRWKIAMHGDRLGTRSLNVFYLVVRSPDGAEHRARMTPTAYLQMVAATNFKQRVRKMLEYYHADRLVYAATATPNRLEYDQGFFVKLGDGAGDIKPIAGLYKTQVYRLAAHLGVPEAIVRRAPTTDTYSLAQSQEEFYFSVPYEQLDLILWAKNHGVAPDEVASAMGLGAEQVSRVYADIDQKRRTTAYLHAPPLLLEAVPEVAPFAPRLDRAGAGAPPPAAASGEADRA